MKERKAFMTQNEEIEKVKDEVEGFTANGRSIIAGDEVEMRMG